MGFLLKLLGIAGTGGLGLLGSILPGVASAIGGMVLKYKETQAARENKQDEHATYLAGSWLAAVTESNKMRAEARRNEGAWGPLGMTTLGIGMCFTVHIAAVTMDSLPLLPGIIFVWGYVPLPWLVAHDPCRCVLALPPAMQAVELEAIRALFYVAPPAAAAAVIVKTFRR